MAEDRMALLEMLRKATADGDPDFLREGVRVLAQAVMEAEVSELTGLPQGRARPRAPADVAQRVPRPPLGHPGGHHRPRDPQGPRRLVLPVPPRAEASGRARPARGRPGGVRAGREHEASRRPRPGARHRGDQPQRGEPDLRRARRRGGGLPGPLARGRGVPVLSGSTQRTSRSARQGRVVSMAALVATGVATSGERRILGLELAAGNDEGSAWPAFIRSLVERGLEGSASSSATTMRAW